MSELTPCNYCTFNKIKTIYNLTSKSDHTLKIVKEPTKEFTKAIGIYIYPKYIRFSKLPTKEKEKYKKAWFAELPDHCCC